jgi:hypothetical protein
MKDPLELLIKDQLDALPRWCKGLEGDLESHDWVNAYGNGNELTPWKGLDRLKTIMLPYYLCKHCHAVSNDFTTFPDIKRVR